MPFFDGGSARILLWISKDVVGWISIGRFRSLGFPALNVVSRDIAVFMADKFYPSIPVQIIELALLILW